MKRELFVKGVLATACVVALLFVPAAGVFAARTDKNFTLDDNAGDSPSVIMRDQDENTLSLRKLDAGSAEIVNDEGDISVGPAAGSKLSVLGGAAFGSAYSTATLSDGDVAVYGDVAVNGNVIAAAPTADNHVTTKAYVDASGGGGDATAANQTTIIDAIDGFEALLTTQTLSAANETVAAGYYEATTLSAVDTDLAAGNIKNGVTIFGFAGAIPNDEWTAAASDIIAGVKAGGSDCATITGTMTTQTLSADDDTVAAGIYEATTLSAVDTDLAAGNIKDGVTIFGFAGTVSAGSGHELPDTGQEVSYTDTFGEDSDYQPAGSQPSYTDNGDGTITDNRTGLMWAKDGNGAGCYSGGTRTWEQALSFAEGLTFATYSDWRLPNVKELQSIVDYGEYDPSINTTYFPNTYPGYYWSATTYVGDTSYAWDVHFGVGSVGYNAKTSYIYVRCVREGQ